MQYARKYDLGFVFGGLVAILLIASTNASAQNHKKLHLTTNAMGTSTQLGRLVSVDIRVNSYSTAEDQKALLEAFQENGSQGLANAVDKMSSKGRIAITGTVGYDLHYIREFKMPDGTTKIRFVTDRPIAFGEHWGSTRSTDYSLSMGEVIISHKKGKSTGTLLPAAKFRLDKDKELEIETFQNPWNLTNIIIW